MFNMDLGKCIFLLIIIIVVVVVVLVVANMYKTAASLL